MTSSAFRREHHGVIYGRLKYAENLKLAQGSSYLLRRNIHRLEKGLIMKPRRDIFATDYIEETVESYKNLVLSRNRNAVNSELQWAHDVLQQYFSVVASEPTIDQAKEKFLRLEPLCSNNPCVPYQRNLSNPSAVSYNQFLELCHRRRSVRWYLPKPVPENLLDQAIAAANLSPSACNRQPFEFRIFDEPALVQKVASIPMGTKGFNHNFPVIVVVVGKLRAYFSERDRHVIYIDGALASMSFMYALETLGLSSCPINWPDMEPQESQMAKLLNLEPDERAIMLISVGYPDPDGMVPYSQKKPLNQIRRYN
ncbi:nitroreductase family protein [Gloeocapsopsis dulcis]|uniref:nitroreductase family protein n=1 Tax=Gloeocapsopsis dulcis TaxID=2859516 RepID=UPI0018C75073|nr:nitroreductase family protein [Gloeocapsopsis dulcis]WNN91004.1 nitroreductase family protein [Gloeocapsopsis dulcis]